MTDGTPPTPAHSTSPPTHTVVFTPAGRSGEVPHGTTVLAAARSLSVDLDSVCGGRGLCGRCLVTPTEGELARWRVESSADHLGPWTPSEDAYRGRRAVGQGQRLGCAATVIGDVVIDVPPASQLNRPVIRKSVEVGDLTVDPLVALHYVELDERADDDGTSAATELRTALAAQWDLAPVVVEPWVLPGLHAAVASRAVTVAVRHEDRDGPGRPQRVVGAWAGYVDRVAGVAVDIGSTTIAAYLCDLATGEALASGGRMNPQIRFGEDLMSRVSYAMLNEGGAEAMTTAVRGALDELIGELVGEVEDLDRSQVVELVVVANPIMHHLALGIDPTPLGQAPFPLATSDPVVGPAALVGVEAPSAQLYVAPCIAGHVGADAAAAILSEGPHRSGARQLLVDVGTNAEIVLGDHHRLLAASSPTGPAFEGAQISGGQRATVGAIERVRIDRDTLEPRYRVIGVEAWSDEPGFDDQVAALGGVTGICGSGIVEIMAELFLSGVIDSQGVIGPGAPSPGSGPGGERRSRPGTGAAGSRVVAEGRTFSYVVTDQIRVTQADVRAVQLAKAALRAGIELLLERWRATDPAGAIDEIRLAGAFGHHLDPLYAMVLGLIPDCPLAQVRSVGNAAGAGAVRALVSGAQRREMEEVVARVTKIETATEPRFQDHFVAALPFPHRDAPTPNLVTVVDLPSPDGDASPGRAGRRNRRRRRPAATIPTAAEQ